MVAEVSDLALRETVRCVCFAEHYSTMIFNGKGEADDLILRSQEVSKKA